MYIQETPNSSESISSVVNLLLKIYLYFLSPKVPYFMEIIQDLTISYTTN